MTQSDQLSIHQRTESSPASPTHARDVRDTESTMSQLDQLEGLVHQAVDTNMGRIAPPVLTIVIPVYNEAQTILSIVESVRALPVAKQIVVVDDGSTDGTVEQLRTLNGASDVDVFLHAVNQGKGTALQTGFRMAEGNIVIVQDADLEYSPSDILKVIQPILDGQAKVVYGSRYLEKDEHPSDSWLHRLGNAWLTKMSNVMTGQRLTDMETCYKAFSRELLRSIPIRQRRFGFEPEITAKLARRGIKILEVPISYRSRSWNEGKKIGIRDLFNAIYCIVRYGLAD